MREIILRKLLSLLSGSYRDISHDSVFLSYNDILISRIFQPKLVLINQRKNIFSCVNTLPCKLGSTLIVSLQIFRLFVCLIDLVPCKLNIWLFKASDKHNHKITSKLTLNYTFWAISIKIVAVMLDILLNLCNSVHFRANPCTRKTYIIFTNTASYYTFWPIFK